MHSSSKSKKSLSCDQSRDLPWAISPGKVTGSTKPNQNSIVNEIDKVNLSLNISKDKVEKVRGDVSKDIKGGIEQHFSFVETPNKVENCRQRHLHSKIINNFESANKRSPLKPDMKIRLKRNLKQKNTKLIQNKPENSGLRNMFLKIVEKRN